MFERVLNTCINIDLFLNQKLHFDNRYLKELGFFLSFDEKEFDVFALVASY